jgi:hypothetical protein
MLWIAHINSKLIMKAALSIAATMAVVDAIAVWLCWLPFDTLDEGRINRYDVASG